MSQGTFTWESFKPLDKCHKVHLHGNVLNHFHLSIKLY